MPPPPLTVVLTVRTSDCPAVLGCRDIHLSGWIPRSHSCVSHVTVCFRSSAAMMCSWAFTFPQQWDPEGICHRFPALSEAKLPRKSQTTKTSLSWLWRPRLLLLVLLLMLLSLLLLLLLLQLRFWKRLSSNCCVRYRDVQVVRAMKMSAPVELRLAIKTFLPIRYLKTIATGTALKSFFYPSPGAWTSGTFNTGPWDWQLQRGMSNRPQFVICTLFLPVQYPWFQSISDFDMAPGTYIPI